MDFGQVYSDASGVVIRRSAEAIGGCRTTKCARTRIGAEERSRKRR
jgi:hypothetical protein